MINKQDVIKLIKELESRVSEDLYRENDETVLDILANKIEGMEDVGEWIPVEQGLPEETDGNFYPAMHVTTIEGIVGWGFYRCDDKAWYLYNEGIQEWEEIECNRIIAWMPHPEPYREVES